MTDDLITFLRARLDEDERSVHGNCTCGDAPRRPDCADRVLADVAAKRAILDEIAGWRHLAVEDGWYSCSQAVENDDYAIDMVCIDERRIGKPCDCGLDARRDRLVRLLAAPYADHPEYRDEWRPQ